MKQEAMVFLMFLGLVLALVLCPFVWLWCRFFGVGEVI